MTDRREKLNRLVLGLCAAGAMLFPTGAYGRPGSEGPLVDWAVSDRFRLFSEASADAKARVAALMETIAAAPRRPLSAHFDGFVRTLAYANGESLRRSNYTPVPRGFRHGSGRYRRDYLYPESYSVDVRLPAAAPGATCRWRTGHDLVEAPCESVTTVRVGPGKPRGDTWGVEADLFLSVDGRPETRTTIAFNDKLVVALGDSYISGEGNPDVPSVVTDRPLPVFRSARWGDRLIESRSDYVRATWWDEPCHRSLLSWPVLSTLAYSAHERREAVTLVHLGCSGATVNDIVRRGEVELPGGGDEQPGDFQLAQLDRLLGAVPRGSTQRRPDRILLSVGGNDAGFVGVIMTLLLPPGGYAVPIIGPIAVGAEAKAVCPYRRTGLPLARLCSLRDSAQKRLEEHLPEAYERLASELTSERRRWGPVYQFAYPNALLGEGGLPCNRVSPRDPQSVEAGSGFEAAMGIIPNMFRGSFFSWDFRLVYDGECGPTPGVGDSEVCQALWVHRQLNSAVEEQARHWTVVNSHLGAIDGSGLCRWSDAFPLGLPRIWPDPTDSSRQVWQDGWTPQSYRPYDSTNPRWFRTTNDSIVSQYGGPDRFHHGTAHPTLMAHLAYADAALEKALGMPPR
jgi:hypothetical protein